MSAIHLPVGGSTASRTINCPAWLERATRVPKPGSNKYADEGNLLHDAMEAHYRDGTPFHELVGKLEYKGLVLEEHHIPELLQPAADALESVLDEYDIEEMFFEPFVQIIPDYAGGSIDVLGVSADGETLLVADYKFGQGRVNVEGNAQLQFYALAAITDPKTRAFSQNCTRVVFAIIQPKLSHQAQVWEQPISALTDFKSQLDDALANPDRAAPGSHCQYCPAAPVCPERKQQARAALLLDPKTSDEVAEALQLALDLEVWVKQVKDQAEDLAFQGARLPGFKLVRGRSIRRYTEEAEAGLVEELGEEAYSRKLIPVTEAEKKLGKGVLEDRGWAEKPDGKLVLVPETDKREAVPVQTDENLKKFVDKLSTRN